MRRCEDEQMWRWEDVKMWGCEYVRMWRCEDVKMWRWEDVKLWRWEGVKMRRCEDQKMRRCEDKKMWRCEDDVKMWGCEDEKMWRWEAVKMRRWDTDPRYWKNPALRRSREKRLNVTKCQACHAKRSNEMFETSKNDPFCRTYHRHGHTALTRTLADGCERLRTVANGCERKRNVERTHPQSLDPQSETEPLLHPRLGLLDENQELEPDFLTPF